MTEFSKRKKTFQKLMLACREQDAYSVSMMCTKANIAYDQIQAWAQEDEIWALALEMCQGRCNSNTQRAILFVKISKKNS